MGFAIYYRSTEELSDAQRDAIERSADRLCEGRTWLSCEPVGFFHDDSDGYLEGFSKPNFMPYPEDVAAAEAEELPDGTVSDVVKILCQLSREYAVDWELSAESDPIRFIHDGEADHAVLCLAEGYDELLGEIDELGDEAGDKDDGDDEGPQILPFRPLDE